jgi:hypothetical protein
MYIVPTPDRCRFAQRKSPSTCGASIYLLPSRVSKIKRVTNKHSSAHQSGKLERSTLFANYALHKSAQYWRWTFFYSTFAK